MNTPPPNVLKRIEDITANYKGNSSEIFGPLLGFLWRDSNGIADVMYVSTQYMESMNNNPTQEWPGYEYYPADSMQHSPW